MCRKEKVSKTNIRINQLTKARTEHELIEKELNEILNGIPDVVKVYNPDYTISFFNDAGYKFYNIDAEDIKGKRCYEILGRTEKCIDCSCEEAVQKKKMIYKERYVQELNKFMDICYNPILDENGEIIYIVERLSDVTEKKVLQKSLEEREERYKAAINSIPDPVVVILDNIIVLANREACSLVNLDYDKLIGTNIFKHFPKKYVRSVHARYKRILAYKKMKDIVEYDFNHPNNKTANLQISHSYILYDGKPAIIAVIRDITEIRNELNKAAELQRKTLQNDFPAKEFIDINLVYVPANIVSGDFYRIYKINDELIIGMITDVRGKGISAALSISAFDVLCFQELQNTHEPIEIINNLNKN
ncbi:PAS domain S-box protein [Clostridium saccharobutylicum]|uniref:PAS domain S-box protein n=1 Tax=Clostridium saccharobutylicum TaxID=169679 RepID=UPI0017C30246|nr:PAS domain S-box-containing protein [Clostridium saccharobutylicum]